MLTKSLMAWRSGSDRWSRARSTTRAPCSAGFANPKMAEFINAAIDDGLQTSGAEEVTAKYRTGPRLVTLNGAVYLRPTIVRCDSFAHPLAIREYLFPYASVLEVPQAEDR